MTLLAEFYNSTTKAFFTRAIIRKISLRNGHSRQLLDPQGEINHNIHSGRTLASKNPGGSIPPRALAQPSAISFNGTMNLRSTPKHLLDGGTGQCKYSHVTSSLGSVSTIVHKSPWLRNVAEHTLCLARSQQGFRLQHSQFFNNRDPPRLLANHSLELSYVSPGPCIFSALAVEPP